MNLNGILKCSSNTEKVKKKKKMKMKNKNRNINNYIKYSLKIQIKRQRSTGWITKCDLTICYL